MKSDTKHVERVEWKHVESRVQRVSSALADKLGKIAEGKRPGSSASMLLARFPYGHPIIRGSDGKAQAQLVPPCEDKDGRCDACKDLVSASMGGRPLGIVLSKSVESYLEYIDATGLRTVPLRFISSGEIFGTLDVLQRLSLTQAQ